jgi:hypothetical protein
MFKYTHPHWYTKKFSANENRLISFAGDTPDSKPGNTPEAEEKPGEKPDEERDKAEDVAAVQSKLDGRIANATASIENFPEEFKKQMKNNIAQFCEVSYDQMANTDGNESMSKDEYPKWKVAAMNQIDAALSGIEGEGDGAKDDQEKGEENLKSIEAEMSDLEGELGVLDHSKLDLNPANLKHPKSLEVGGESKKTFLEVELGKYEQRAGAINEQRNALAGKMKEVTQVKGAFDKQVEANNVIAGVTGGAVLVGAVGVAVATSWVPGLNLVTGAVALAAAAVAAATKAALIASERAMAKKANASITEFKGKYNKKRVELAGVVKDMREDGTMIHNAAPELRAEIETTRDTNLEAGTVSLGENEVNREQVTAELARAEAQLVLINEHKERIAQQQLDLETSRLDAQAKGEQVDASKHGLGTKLSSVESAIAQIEESGALEGGNEEAKAKYKELLGYKEKMKGGVALLGTGGDQLKEFMAGTEGADEQFDEQASLLAYREATLTSTSASLELAGLSLDTNIVEMQEALGAIDAGAAAEIKTVNKVQGEIVKGVSAVAIENIKAQSTVEMEYASMQNVKVEEVSFASALAVGAAAPFEKIFGGMSYMLELGKDIPVLGSGFSFLSGVSEAVGDITGGMAKMVVLLPAALGGNEEGIHMAKAMGSLALCGTTEGSREAWTGMGKAIVAADEWGTDGAKAAGKAAANIAMFFIPGAQGATGGIAVGRAAFAATRVAGGGVRNAALATAKGIGVGLKTTVVESAKSYRSMARGAAKKIRGIPGALRKAPGALKRGVKGLKARVTGRGKGAAAEGVATEGAAAETAAEATAATTESTAARGSVLDDAGNVLDDAGNVIDDAARTPQNLAEGTRGTMKSARQVRDGMNPDKFGEVSKNGILKDQPSAMKEFLEGKSSSITVKEMNAEIARCKQYMKDLPASDKAAQAAGHPSGKMGQLGAHETMVNGLKQLRAQTRAIKAARTKLTDSLPFKEGQKVKLVNKNGDVTFRGKYTIDSTTGKVRMESLETGAGGTKFDVKYCSPERLRNFRQAAGKPSTAPAAKPAPASTPATASVPTGTPTSAPATAPAPAGTPASAPAPTVAPASAPTVATSPTLASRAMTQARAVWIQAKRAALRLRRTRSTAPTSTPASAPAPTVAPASAPTVATSPTLASRAMTQARAVWIQAKRAALRLRRTRTAAPASTVEAAPVVEAAAETVARGPGWTARTMDRFRAWRRKGPDARARYAERLEAGRGARASNRVRANEARANRTVNPEALEAIPGSAMETVAPVIDTTVPAVAKGPGWTARTMDRFRNWRSRRAEARTTARAERAATNKRTATKKVNRKATRRRVSAENKVTARVERTAAEVNATEVFMSEELGYVRLDEMEKVIAAANADTAVSIYNRLEEVLHELVPNRGAGAVRTRLNQLRTRAGNRVPAEIMPEALQKTEKLIATREHFEGMTNKQLKTEYKKLTDPNFEVEMRYMADGERTVAEAAREHAIAETSARIKSGAMSEGRIARPVPKQNVSQSTRVAMPDRLPNDFRTWTNKDLQTAFQQRRIAQSQGAGTQAEQMYMGRDIGDIIGQLKVRGVAPLEPGMAEIAVLPPRLKGGSYRNWSDARLQEAFQQRRIAQSQGIGTQVEQMYMGSDLDTIISQLNARKVAPIEPPATGGFSNAA